MLFHVSADSSKSEKTPRHGFTVVEVMVVIAIIALLVALLIPAVQSTREAARRTQCASHQRQVALATLEFAEEMGGELPEWGWDRLSWRNSVAPYLEEDGLDRTSRNAFRESLQSQASKEILVFQCPSTPAYPRRFPELETNFSGTAHCAFLGAQLFSNVGARDVYAPLLLRDPLFSGDPLATAWCATNRVNSSTNVTELMAKRAQLKRITDGLSRTLLLSEQAGLPDHYVGRRLQQASSNANAGAWLVQFESPYLFQRGRTLINGDNRYNLYSFHRGVNASFCDGSLRFVHDDADMDVVVAMLTRSGSDGLNGQ